MNAMAFKNGRVTLAVACAMAMVLIHCGGCTTRTTPPPSQAVRVAPPPVAATQPVTVRKTVLLPECIGPGGLVAPPLSVTFVAKVHVGDSPDVGGEILTLDAGSSKLNVPRTPVVVLDPMIILPPDYPDYMGSVIQSKFQYTEFKLQVVATLYVVYSECPRETEGKGIVGFHLRARQELSSRVHMEQSVFNRQADGTWPLAQAGIGQPFDSDWHWVGEGGEADLNVSSAPGCYGMIIGAEFGQLVPIDNKDIGVPVGTTDVYH